MLDINKLDKFFSSLNDLKTKVDDLDGDNLALTEVNCPYRFEEKKIKWCSEWRSIYTKLNTRVNNLSYWD